MFFILTFYIISIFRIEANFSVTYNFTYLDQLIHDLQKSNLYVGFELMGNPSNYFTDFENATQVYMWRDLIKDTATHLIGKLHSLLVLFKSCPY